ncbi:hypothetical protein JVU11DRAFT_9803 [Chiua virens]|nr:hypothetical protein JVU11DRAFT_9803 [Chiua virens]
MNFLPPLSVHSSGVQCDSRWSPSFFFHEDPGSRQHMTRSRDIIHIHELLLTLSISNEDVDSKELNPHAILLSLSISHDISSTARSDNLTYSINYATIYKELVDTLPQKSYSSLEALAENAFETVFRSHPDVHDMSVVVSLRDRLPRFTLETARRRDQPSVGPYQFTVDGLTFPAIIGVNPRERIEKQPVVFDITVQRPTSQDHFPFFGLAKSIP